MIMYNRQSRLERKMERLRSYGISLISVKEHHRPTTILSEYVDSVLSDFGSQFWQQNFDMSIIKNVFVCQDVYTQFYLLSDNNNN